jgi:hypothetical protein
MKARAEALPVEPDRPIAVGDTLLRKPAKRTPYPPSWFGKDENGRPIPDGRPDVTRLEAAVIGHAFDGWKVRTDDGRNFCVSREAVEAGEWVLLKRCKQCSN